MLWRENERIDAPSVRIFLFATALCQAFVFLMFCVCTLVTFCKSLIEQRTLQPIFLSEQWELMVNVLVTFGGSWKCRNWEYSEWHCSDCNVLGVWWECVTACAPSSWAAGHLQGLHFLLPVWLLQEGLNAELSSALTQVGQWDLPTPLPCLPDWWKILCEQLCRGTWTCDQSRRLITLFPGYKFRKIPHWKSHSLSHPRPYESITDW